MSAPSIITARAVSASFEDPVLESVYRCLGWLAGGDMEVLEAFCRYTEQRIGMFLPAARAELISGVMLRRAEIPGAVEPPAATEHQIYLTINLVEAVATLSPALAAGLTEKIASLGWTQPWLEKVAAFIEGTEGRSDGILSFSSHNDGRGQLVLRGLYGGTLRAMESGGHWFVRHDCPEPLIFSGLRWPAQHSLWLKETDHILIGGDERLDLSAVSSLSEENGFPDLHISSDVDGLAVTSAAEGALARLSWENGWLLTPHEPIMLNGRPITTQVNILPADKLVIGGKTIPAARLIHCAKNSGRSAWSLRLERATVRFPDGQSGLDDITLALESGDMVAVMGPSGCGKSTLMSVLSGGLSLTSGRVIFKPQTIRPSFALVPQDDILFSELTVTENLRYAAALRTTEALPDISGTLAAVGLEAKGELQVGSVTEKVLSGGERKRLNIGLELIGRPDALLLDEPTSGLSSADAESVMKILRARANAGVLVMAVIHQPSSEVFSKFDKVIVLDVGGRLAFFGTPEATRDYFGIHVAGALRQNWGPDGILDSLVGRRTTLDGGAQRRNFDPAFWKLRYSGARHTYEPPLIRREESTSAPQTKHSGKPWPFVTAFTLLRRESLRRIRGWRSVVASCVIAVVLAAIVAWVCRIISGAGEYSFTANRHLPAFCFLNVILVQFLALSSSVQELVKDRAHRLRERLLKIPGSFWLLAKLPGLAIQSALQAALVVWTGAWIIDLPYGKMELWLALTLAGWTSVALGLFVSALPGISERVALAAVPLMLVPQMILCGAAPFDFRDLSHLHWPSPRPVIEEDTAAPAPWPAQAMPSRWAYQAAICGLRDHPAIITKGDLKPLFKTYNFARSLVDVWKADPGEFLNQLEQKTGRRLTEAEVRADIARLVLNDKRSAKEVADTFGSLVPGTFSLKPIRNEFFLGYAASTFPPVTSLHGKETRPAVDARWNLGRLGIFLLFAATLAIQIPPRAFLSLIRRRKS